MASKYTEAQARATRKYLSKTVSIQIRVTEEEREQYKKAAAKHNMSLTQYIKYLLERV